MKHKLGTTGFITTLLAALVSFASIPAESQVLPPAEGTPIAVEDRSQPDELIAVNRPCEFDVADGIADLEPPDYDDTNPCVYPTPQPPVCP